MHPRNPYRDAPDFQALAESYPQLKDYLIASANSSCLRFSINYQNADSQIVLTKALLHRDFGLKFSLPESRLCPPVPNRMNYVLWIEDIVGAHRDFGNRGGPIIRGIDVGTGASAIYPLLACSRNAHWEMVATELDDISFLSAQSNIQTNDLQGRIHLTKASLIGLILSPLERNSDDQFHFSMCNPPFYSSAEEITISANDKEFPPNAVCTGADIEMIYSPGGEVEFVSRMVRESERFRTRCKWYTSMLGKMSSVVKIVELFQERSISNYAITEFVQGQTRRWGVGWSFTDSRLPDALARLENANPTLLRLMPKRNTNRHSFKFGGRLNSAAELHKSLGQLIDSMGVFSVHKERRVPDTNHTLSENDPISWLDVYVVQATKNGWSRGARRKKRISERAYTKTDEHVTSHDKIAPRWQPSGMVCSVCWQFSSAEELTRILEVQWINGCDRALFESFANHITRRVGELFNRV